MPVWHYARSIFYMSSSKKIYYEKVGRKYVPVREYDPDLIDSLPEGTHLIMCYPSGASRRYNVNPDHAAMIAAARLAEHIIVRSIVAKSELEPAARPLTDEQREAWMNLAEKLGGGLATLCSSSVHDCVQAGIQAMISEAEQLLTNPTVRAAYDHFMLTVEISRQKQHG